MSIPRKRPSANGTATEEPMHRNRPLAYALAACLAGIAAVYWAIIARPLPGVLPPARQFLVLPPFLCRGGGRTQGFWAGFLPGGGPLRDRPFAQGLRRTPPADSLHHPAAAGDPAPAPHD